MRADGAPNDLNDQVALAYVLVTYNGDSCCTIVPHSMCLRTLRVRVAWQNKAVTGSVCALLADDDAI